MASQISDEPVVQLQALERALGALTAKATAAFARDMHVQLTALVAVVGENIKSMQDGEMFGQTLKQAQLKALQEFSAAVHAISNSLQPGSAPPLAAAAAPGGASSAGGRSADGGRTAAAAARALFPAGCGCGPASPEAFYRVREALALALKSFGAAFKSSHPGLARAVKGVVDDLEETGLFD